MHIARNSGAQTVNNPDAENPRNPDAQTVGNPYAKSPQNPDAQAVRELLQAANVCPNAKNAHESNCARVVSLPGKSVCVCGKSGEIANPERVVA